MNYGAIYRSVHDTFWYQTTDNMWRHCNTGMLLTFDEANAIAGPFRLVAKELPGA